MNEIKQWFLDQSPRDQMMVSVGGVAVLIYILFFLVLFPMQNDLDRKEKRNMASLQEQQEVRQLAGQVLARQQAGQASAGAQNLTSLLNDSTREFGLTMENVQPSGNSARVRLGASDFNKVLAWLHEMEIKRGLQISDVTITAERNPGVVMVNLQLTQGG